MNEVAEAYSPAGVTWQTGPGRIYDVLSEHLVAWAPHDLSDRLVLDLGAGTGAASRALMRRGARPIAADTAEGMVRIDAHRRPPALLGDALALPIRTGGVDGVVAAFSLNHLTDPVTALREAARVTRQGGPILVATYAADDDHPVKAAVDRAAAEAGHRPPDWYRRMREQAMPLLATVERVETVLGRAGLGGCVVHERVRFPELAARDLVAWRLGLAHLAPFAATLDRDRADRLERRALEILGDDPPQLERCVIHATASAPRA